jgi:hypothetical protein
MDIKKLNELQNNLEWDILHYDLWEVFDEPQNINQCEILMARIFMDTLKIDIDDQYLIRFAAEPKHFANLCVHFLRKVQSEYPGIISEDGCQKNIYGE